MAIDIRDLDPNDPEYEAKMEAALREEYEADGLVPPGEGGEQAGDKGTEGESGTESKAEEGTKPADGAADGAGEGGGDGGPQGDAAEAKGDGAKTDPAQPAEGVLSKNGKVLPYVVLQHAREEAKQSRIAKKAAEDEAAALREKLAKLESSGVDKDMRERAEDGLLTDEEREDHPHAAKLEKALQDLKKSQTAAAPPAPTAAPVPATTGRSEQEMLDERRDAIDSVPELALWEATDPEKWALAVKHDAVLEDSPKWSKRPLAERYAEAARRAAAEFEDEMPLTPVPPVATPAPAKAAAKPGSAPATAKPRQDPTKAIENAPRAMPSTLSDFKGGADPSASRDGPSFWDMTDEEIEASLRKGYG